MNRFVSVVVLGSVLATSANAAVSSASASQQVSAGVMPAVVKNKSFNVQSSILSDLIGAVNLNVNFRLSPAFTAGPTAEYWSLSESDGDGGTGSVRLWSVGAQAEYAFNGDIMRDGVLLNPYVAYNAAENVNASKYGVSGISAGALVQYQWIWQSGFNVQLGVGAGYSTVKTSSPATEGSGEVNATHGVASVELGYAF